MTDHPDPGAPGPAQPVRWEDTIARLERMRESARAHDQALAATPPPAPAPPAPSPPAPVPAPSPAVVAAPPTEPAPAPGTASAHRAAIDGIGTELRRLHHPAVPAPTEPTGAPVAAEPVAVGPRPPRAARAQGTSPATTEARRDRRAAENANPSPRGQVVRELRRAADARDPRYT